MLIFHKIRRLEFVFCILFSVYRKPWQMKVDPDLSGEMKHTTVMPGQLFLYESAKLPHGRPDKLEGDHSAHIFIHFKPKGWAYTNMDRVYGVPPNWDGKRIVYGEDGDAPHAGL